MDPAEDGLPVPQRYWAILTLMVGVALSCLDTALVNVALPRIAKDLNCSPADSIWVVNAYQLAVMISLLPLGSFGDIFGYHRVYRWGLMLYTGAALISALAGSLEMLTVGRALQGLGAAGIMSVNTALVRYTWPRRQLGRGIAMVSLVVSTSSAAGPSMAAMILSVASWPWLFAVNVPIGILTLALSMRLLPRTEPTGRGFDLWSGVLCAVMFGSLISGINGAGHHQASIAVAGEFVGAVVTGCRSYPSTCFAGPSFRCR
jgi:MFS transporter, DHA2 family, multidrug resistance protein